MTRPPVRIISPALLWISLILATSCAEQATLLIEIQHPDTFDPSLFAGELAVEFWTGEQREVVARGTTSTSSLTVRHPFLDHVDLEEGSQYRLYLHASQSAGCVESDGAVSGTSPPFRYAPGQEQITVYLDCAGKASPTGDPASMHFMGTTAFLPAPAPYGQVVMLGGASKVLDLSKLAQEKEVQLADQVEVYDPVQGRFSPLPTPLPSPSLGQQLTAISEDELVISGGVSKDSSALLWQYLDRLLLLKNGRFSEYSQRLDDRRALHGAAAIAPGQLLVAGGTAFSSLANAFAPLSSLEYVVLDGTSPTHHRLSMSAARIMPVVVPFHDGRQALIAGGRADGLPDQAVEVFCATGDCPCGPGPCIYQVAGPDLGKSRQQMTGTYVPCAATGPGAIYLVGGQESTTETYHPDIYCLDTASADQLQRVGTLQVSRGLHSTTYVEDELGQPWLLVAGGLEKATGGTAAMTSAELFPVSCTCETLQPEARQLITLPDTLWILHNAVRLADGTALLVGGMQAQAIRFNPMTSRQEE